MNIHGCARSCPASRVLLVQRVLDEGWAVSEAAESIGLSERSGYKWLRRYREQGDDGLRDRSSRPRRIRCRIDEERKQLIIKLRRESRMTGAAIAEQLRLPPATVARTLAREGLSRLKSLEPAEPVQRYEHKRAGDLLHLDIKKLGRFGQPGHRVTGDRRSRSRTDGWEFVHVAIDDFSRLAYVEVLASERKEDAIAFLRRACTWFRGHGIRIRRLLTDNGSCYVSAAFASVCVELRIKHRFTRPYRPQTNGKAERLIQTLLREWAYVRRYRSSAERRYALRPWLRRYNFKRPHGSLGRKPPASRIPRPG